MKPLRKILDNVKPKFTTGGSFVFKTLKYFLMKWKNKIKQLK